MLLESPTGQLPTGRLAIVAAHPDDEIIGAGALLGRRRHSWIVHLTDGSPRRVEAALAAGMATREAYAARRRAELHEALAHVNIRPDHCVQLGCVDQEASLQLEDLASRLAGLFRRTAAGVEAVVTHPYEGGHPDHDAAAFAVSAAVRMLARDRVPAPAVFEMTSYHAGPSGIRTGSFLQRAPRAATVRLSRAERARKRAMLACFTTQQQMLAFFRTDRERFRRAPVYRFAAAPHAGPLFYEYFDWGMDGARWRQLAARALERLDLPPCR